MTTALDWSAYPGASGGFQGAVEMCNNNGACRALAGGVMCPSYRVTRDERDVTRGRANTLRLAITGQLGPGAFTSDEMAETLKLCVSCKACRRECPTGVDMARMKIEFLSARAAQRGLTLHDRLVGYLPRYAPYAAKVPWLMNLRDRLPGAAKLSEGVTGFSARRSLPKWRADYFRDPTGHDGGQGRDVVLFADTFNRYFERENIDAACTVLEAAGYRVHFATPPDDSRPLCCGRTFLSVGKTDEARREAERTLSALAPFVAQGIPVVGLEPSCLFAFRDEIPALIKTDTARLVAERAILFEEFLADEAKAGRLQLPLAPMKKQAFLHGHCHQKSFDAMSAVEAALRLVPELAVEKIEFELLRHGWRLRLRGRHDRRILRHGRAVVVAGGAQGAGRCAHRRRRHLVPAANPRRRAARSAACGARAGDGGAGGVTFNVRRPARFRASAAAPGN